MHAHVRSIWLAAALIAASMTYVLAAGHNTVAKYDSQGALAPSTIVEVDGKVGIGTATPAATLHLDSGNAAGQLRLTGTGPHWTLYKMGAGDFYLGAVAAGDNDLRLLAGNSTRLLLDGLTGNAGIGTFAPAHRLHVVGDASNVFVARIEQNAPAGYALLSTTNTATANPGNRAGLEFRLNTSGTERLAARLAAQFANTSDSVRTSTLQFITTDAGSSVDAMFIRGARVGIGTTNPSARLHVSGDVIVDGNIGAKYQDVAEWVEADDDLAPGTVVTTDRSRGNRVRGSLDAYDTAVAGVVSAQPGILLGERGAGKVAVAQSGRVRVRVDASYGAIAPGDLLVTSPTPGHAMRSLPIMLGESSLHRPGTILGKALEAFAGGTGEVLTLITLQ